MKEPIVFFNVKNPAQNPLTRIGYTALRSAGQLIVYCTDEGPLDPKYRAEWAEWQKNQKPKA